jgi:hypothetical protein
MARPEITGRATLKHSTGPPQAAAQTIKEFCADNRISRAQYYRLKEKGLGPDETRFGDDGKIVLITQESARAWRKRHTQAASSAA